MPTALRRHSYQPSGSAAIDADGDEATRFLRPKYPVGIGALTELITKYLNHKIVHFKGVITLTPLKLTKLKQFRFPLNNWLIKRWKLLNGYNL